MGAAPGDSRHHQGQGRGAPRGAAGVLASRPHRGRRHRPGPGVRAPLRGERAGHRGLPGAAHRRPGRRLEWIPARRRPVEAPHRKPDLRRRGRKHRMGRRRPDADPLLERAPAGARERQVRMERIPSLRGPAELLQSRLGIRHHVESEHPPAGLYQAAQLRLGRAVPPRPAGGGAARFLPLHPPGFRAVAARRASPSRRGPWCRSCGRRAGAIRPLPGGVRPSGWRSIRSAHGIT